MIEYLYNAIRMVAGQEEEVYTIARDDEGFIDKGVVFMLHSPEGEVIAKVDGIYNPNTYQWTFIIPAEATAGRTGKHWYCFMREGKNLCFKQPFYLL